VLGVEVPHAKGGIFARTEQLSMGIQELHGCHLVCVSSKSVHASLAQNVPNNDISVLCSRRQLPIVSGERKSCDIRAMATENNYAFLRLRVP
jgi:hypothetical protein